MYIMMMELHTHQLRECVDSAKTHTLIINKNTPLLSCESLTLALSVKLSPPLITTAFQNFKISITIYPILVILWQYNGTYIIYLLNRYFG